jgi:hypothetical protein
MEEREVICGKGESEVELEFSANIPAGLLVLKNTRKRGNGETLEQFAAVRFSGGEVDLRQFVRSLLRSLDSELEKGALWSGE